MKREKFTHTMTENIERAHAFAMDAHHKQTTIGSNKSYMLHLAKTAEILMNHGGTETQLIGCLLKDTLKLTDTRLDQIKSEFGIKVSLIVKVLSVPLVYHQVEDPAVIMIKISETIDLLSRLDSNRLSDEYKREVIQEAQVVLQLLSPLAVALSQIDSDLSMVDILAELKSTLEKAEDLVEG